jgi:tetratricopeptide (TPR) repeat protein
MRYPVTLRPIAFFAAVFVCSLGSACHDAPRPPASPTAGIAGSPGDLEIGAPAIRFSVKPEPLLGLTASDGTGLRLAGMTAQAVVDGSVAFTELRLTFDNPESRTLEGRFRIALPPGASLQRFAMKIGATWQESEVVELTAAREAYEDFLHRKQDPALLENAAGNEFSARVFPIPANGRKELVLSYVQELRQASYVLPLRGLPEVGRLEAQVTVVGAPKQPPRLSLSDDKPSADLVVDLALGSAGDKTTAIRAGDLVVARVKPQAESKPDPLAATIVLVDTSASRGLGFEEELRTVAVVVGRAAAAKGQLTVATFDQQVTPIFEGAASSFGDADMAKVRNHGALGASNLQRALEWAGDTAKKSGKKRIVLITDGVSTAGATDAKRLTATISALRATGIERLDAVATGGIRDDAGLLKLVRNHLPHDGVVVQATDQPSAIARRLDEATRSGVAVQVEGASWAWPTKLDGVQAGDEVSIYAEVPAGHPVKVALDGKPAVVVEPRATARPLVERVVAQAQIASLLERELLTQQDLKKEITALAVRHRVLTPYTAMLVLETEADYARFRIDRRAPPEVLAIDEGKIVRVARAFRGAPAAGPIEIADGAPAKEGRKATETKVATTKSGSASSAPHVQASASPPKPGAPPSAPMADKSSAADEKKKPKDAGSGGAAAAGPTGGSLGAVGALGAGRGDGKPAAVAPSPRAAARPSALAGAGDPSKGAPPAAATRAPAPPPPDVARAPAAKPARRAAPSANEAPSSRAAAEESLARDALQSAQVESGFDGDIPSASRFAEPPPAPRRQERVSEDERRRRIEASDDNVDRVPAYTGRFKEIMDQLGVKDMKGALAAASAWRSEEPADVMALIALGEVAEALGAPRLAARAYGSIVDLFPNRADLRRFAGERLERLADPGALDLAIDTFEKARSDRPDHPASHRLLAMAYLRARQPQKAFEILAAGIQQRYPDGRFRGVDRILREDLGLAAAAWIRMDPKNEEQIRRQLLAAGGAEETGPSLRFVLVWETDANDVDFHIYDGDGNHAFYSRRSLATGGELYADVTTGYGPECFTVRGAKAERAGPYKLQAHYYSRGPMGYGMGKLQVVEHDGKGNISFEERPFVVMNDRAFVDLGTAN